MPQPEASRASRRASRAVWASPNSNWVVYVTLVYLEQPQTRKNELLPFDTLCATENIIVPRSTLQVTVTAWTFLDVSLLRENAN